MLGAVAKLFLVACVLLVLPSFVRIGDRRSSGLTATSSSLSAAGGAAVQKAEDRMEVAAEDEQRMFGFAAAARPRGWDEEDDEDDEEDNDSDAVAKEAPAPTEDDDEEAAAAEEEKQDDEDEEDEEEKEEEEEEEEDQQQDDEDEDEEDDDDEEQKTTTVEKKKKSKADALRARAEEKRIRAKQEQLLQQQRAAPKKRKPVKPAEPERPAELSDFVMEIVAGLFLIGYAFQYFSGKATNEEIARAWAAQVRPLVTEQFAETGAPTGFLERESLSVYRLWCSGRINCRFVVFTLVLKKRHDLFAVLLDYLSPQPDQLAVEVRLDADAAAVVLALVSKKAKAAMHKQEDDLRAFANQYNSPVLSASHVVLAECAEVIEKVFAGDVKAALEKSQALFVGLHFTDRGGPKSDAKWMKFNFILPGRDKMKDLDPLHRAAIMLVDKVARYPLTVGAKEKIAKNRLAAAKANSSESSSSSSSASTTSATSTGSSSSGTLTREQIEEQAQIRRHQKEKEKMDAWAKLPREQQRKEEEKERKRDLKRRQKLRTVAV